MDSQRSTISAHMGPVDEPRPRKQAAAAGSNLVAALLLAPIVILLVTITLGPSVQLLGMSFTNYSPGVADWEFVGLRNYAEIITDRGFQWATARSIIYVVLVVSLELVVGFLIALLLQQPLVLRALWMALVIAAYAVSPIVAVVIWKFMLDPNFGLVNYVITLLGLPAVPWLSTPTSSFAAVVIISVWKDFAFSTIILFAALTTIPSELVEAARVDGARAWQILLRIKLPLILPAILVIALFRVILTLREFAIIWSLTGGGPGTSTEIVSLYLYKEAFRYLDFGRGATTGWLILVITLVLAVSLVRRTTRDLLPSEQEGGR